MVTVVDKYVDASSAPGNPATSGGRFKGLEQSFDVTVSKGEGLPAVWIIWMAGQVVWHDQVVIADLLECSHHLEHIQVSFVGIDFLEAVPLAPDITEVDIEELPPFTEVTKNDGDLFPGVLEHFGYGADAEVQSMIRTGRNFDEPLQSLDRPQDTIDPSIAANWDSRIVRMTGHPNFIL